MELAPGAGDGCSTRDGAGLRRRLAAAPGLNLGVTGHGRYRDASGHLADSDARLPTHFGLHSEIAHTTPDFYLHAVGHRTLDYCWSWCYLKRVSARASFKKSEAREVRVFVRHCITRERVEIAAI